MLRFQRDTLHRHRLHDTTGRLQCPKPAEQHMSPSKNCKAGPRLTGADHRAERWGITQVMVRRFAMSSIVHHGAKSRYAVRYVVRYVARNRK